MPPWSQYGVALPCCWWRPFSAQRLKWQLTFCTNNQITSDVI
jgi:hypothetical protein